MLVHDLGLRGAREATARRFLLIAFGLLSLAAAVVTMLAARLVLARLEQRSSPGPDRGGGRHSPEFQPVLADVRELVVDRLATESETDGRRPVDAGAAQAR